MIALIVGWLAGRSEATDASTARTLAVEGITSGLDVADAKWDVQGKALSGGRRFDGTQRFASVRMAPTFDGEAHVVAVGSSATVRTRTVRARRGFPLSTMIEFSVGAERSGPLAIGIANQPWGIVAQGTYGTILSGPWGVLIRGSTNQPGITPWALFPNRTKRPFDLRVRFLDARNRIVAEGDLRDPVNFPTALAHLVTRVVVEARPFAWKTLNPVAYRPEFSGQGSSGDLDVRSVVVATREAGEWRTTGVFDVDGRPTKAPVRLNRSYSPHFVGPSIWLELWSTFGEALFDVQTFPCARPGDASRGESLGRSIIEATDQTPRYLEAKVPTTSYVRVAARRESDRWTVLATIPKSPSLAAAHGYGLGARIFAISIGPGRRVVSAYLDAKSRWRSSAPPIAVGANAASLRIVSVLPSGREIASSPIAVTSAASDLVVFFRDGHGAIRSLAPAHFPIEARAFRVEVREFGTTRNVFVKVPHNAGSTTPRMRRPVD